MTTSAQNSPAIFIDLRPHIDFIYTAHQEQPVELPNTYRFWDKRTPYAMHPIWCATTLLTETTLPEALRAQGALTLLYHDVLEDTTAGLPDNLPADVVEGIHHMTFDNFDQEVELLPKKPIHIQLFKLYDKTSNLLDATWMDAKLFEKYWKFTGELCQRVESEYGLLNIGRIYRSLGNRTE